MSKIRDSFCWWIWLKHSNEQDSDLRESAENRYVRRTGWGNEVSFFLDLANRGKLLQTVSKLNHRLVKYSYWGYAILSISNIFIYSPLFFCNWPFFHQNFIHKKIRKLQDVAGPLNQLNWLNNQTTNQPTNSSTRKGGDPTASRSESCHREQAGNPKRPLTWGKISTYPPEAEAKARSSWLGPHTFGWEMSLIDFPKVYTTETRHIQVYGRNWTLMYCFYICIDQKKHNSHHRILAIYLP